MSSKLAREIAIGAGLFLSTSLVCYLVLTSAAYRSDWSVVWKYRSPLWSGWFRTVLLSSGSLVMALAFAVLLYLGQKTGLRTLRLFCQGCVELIRGTPLFVQLLIAFYVVAVALKVDNRYLVGMASLALFSSAYLAEILRGGIESIADSQRDAARAVGFTTAQSYRFVILPQALQRVLPGLAGEFANLIKNSSLLSVVAVSEFTKEVRDASANSYAILELYLPLAVGYLLLTIPIALVTRSLEARYRYLS